MRGLEQRPAEKCEGNTEVKDDGGNVDERCYQGCRGGGRIKSDSAQQEREH